MTEEEVKRVKAMRRKEQNRASQRRFRAKKENELRGAADQVAGMESLINDLQRQNVEMGQINAILKARIAELESQQIHRVQNGEGPNAEAARCPQCGKHSLTSTIDLSDFFWPIECTRGQQTDHLETYLPLFDHNLVPFGS